MASHGWGSSGHAVGRSASTRMAVLLIWSLVGLLAVRTLLTIVLLGRLVQPGTILFLVINVLVAVTALGVIVYLIRPDASARAAH